MHKRGRVVIYLIGVLIVGGAILSAGTAVSAVILQDGTISATIPIGTYDVRQTVDGQEIYVEDFGHLLVPGKPNLPSRIFAIAIPPGAQATQVTFDLGEGIALPGTYRIPPASLPRVVGQENSLVYQREKQTYDDNYASIYGSDEAYPASAGEFVRSAGFRKYNLVDVRITPFAYHPQSGRLIYYPDVRVNIAYSFSKGFSASDIMVDNLPRKERVAQEIILNYQQAQTWYPAGTVGSKETYDFVIITLPLLDVSVAPLVSWETLKGRSVNVVTTTWINSNYTGYDLAEKIRNFLRDKYPSEQWGIEDVLLVGDFDDVPMRRCWQDAGYGKPETDYYYAELSLPDASSWDSNGNHQWGENSDPIDFYAEVNVGRIPYSATSTVQHICEKSAAYEANNDPAYKKHMLLLGAFFWSDTDNAVLMEAKINQPWMSDWTFTRMYEQGYSTYPSDYNLRFTNVRTVWSSGQYAFVNWAGHGSEYASYIMYSTGEAFVSTNTCPYLNDDYPAIVFADACSNSDTDHNNIGRAMMQQGAVGFLGATKVAYGTGAWDEPGDGSSQSLDYYFTTRVTSLSYTQGEAHQWALRYMYTHNLWYLVKYEMFEWGALWGNPDLGMAPVQTYLCGDANADEQIDISDAVYLLNYLYKSGSAPDPLEAGDANNDGTVDVSDAIYLLNYLYKEGPAPGC
jgi:hypothetical protein